MVDLDAPRRTPGRGWKHKVLDGATVHKLMATVPDARTYHVRVSTQEGIVLSQMITKSKLPRSRYIRRALAHWLVTKEGVDPADIPKLMRDL